MSIKKLLAFGFAIVLFLSLARCGTATESISVQGPMSIREQGSFAIGGTVITSPGAYDPEAPFSFAGQTLHGDHAYVFYQIPVNPRQLPLVFLHGLGQFSKTWESTPDGREGFQNIFLRCGFATYLIDEPRRGAAGQSTLPTQINPMTADQMFFRAFRLGIWPDFFPGVQFPQDQESLNQYFKGFCRDCQQTWRRRNCSPLARYWDYRQQAFSFFRFEQY